MPAPADSPIELLLSKLTGVTTSGTTGKRFTACCPAHEDNANSLGVVVWDNGVVTLKCFAGCDNKTIIKAVDLEFRDLFPGRRVREPKPGCTVSLLAFDKRLPVEFLRDVCGFSDDVTDTGRRRVFMPYRDAAGEVMFTRQRRSLDGKGKDKFWQPAGEKLRPFGLHRLPAARAAGSVMILVEGETDAATLWFHGYPALGIPGSNAVGSIEPGDLEGFDAFYVWRDAAKSAKDRSGETFVASLVAKIKAIRPAATVKVIESPDAKDPSELNQKLGEKFREQFDGILAAGTEYTAAPPATAAETEAAAAAGPFRLTDMGNARRLVAQHGRDLRYSHTQDTWYVWAGSRWTPDDSGEVMRRAKATAVSIFGEALTAESAAAREEIALHAMRSQSARSLTNMIQVAKSEAGIPVFHGIFDADPFLFNCINGTVDLRTGELLPHCREHLLTKMSPVAYDPDAKAPVWEQFLAKTFSSDPKEPEAPPNVEMISFMGRLLGYCMTADIREQVLPVMWGGGSNGKSTLLNTIRAVFGMGYYTKAPRALLMARKFESHPTELTVLDGIRLVVATESAQDQRLSEDLVKDLTGGEAIKARRMRENFYEFDPTHKVILCTNHRPRIVDTDDGIWRRVILIEFGTKFWNPDKGEIGPEHLKQDKALFGKLAAEFPGILAWLVRGCIEWQKGGLQAPKAIQDKTAEYREDEDQIQHFMSECCEVSNAAGDTLLKDVYSRFSEWCDENGYRAGSNRRLKAGLIGHSIVVKNGIDNKVTCFGLHVRPVSKNDQAEKDKAKSKAPRGLEPWGDK